MAQMTRDEKIFKLGKIITDRKEALLGIEKMSTESPEYWGIDCGLQYAERRYGKEIADVISEKEKEMDAALARIGELAPNLAIGFVKAG